MTRLIFSYAFNLLLIVSLTSAPLSAEEESDTLFGDWGGFKTYLADSGIATEAVITADIMGVTSGGKKRDDNETVAYTLATTVDTEAAGLWRNVTARAS